MAVTNPDCSELAAAIARLAFDVSAEGNIRDIDGVVTEMQKTVPRIDRQGVVDAIVEATTLPRKALTDEVKAVAALKREAKGETRLVKQLEALQVHLEAGTLPAKRTTSNDVSEAIRLLREAKEEVRVTIRRSDAALAERLNKQIDKLTERLEEQDFAPVFRLPDTLRSEELENLRFTRDQLTGEIRENIQRLKPKTFWETIANVASVPKALITSVDLSAIGRQGFFLGLARPKQAAKRIPGTVGAFFSAKQAAQHAEELSKRYNWNLYHRAGLDITTAEGPLSQREEAYRTTIPDRFPRLLWLVHASNRAYVDFLNVMRAETFDAMTSTMARNAEPTLEEAKAIANYVNIASGRGSLGKLAPATNVLNTIFFSPRYIASRFQFIFGQPFIQGDAATRKLIAKEYAKVAFALSVVYTTALLAGADVEDDPTSSDFGKLKIGNTRIDILAGVSQSIVLISRLISGTRKSATSGRRRALRGEDVPFGGDTAFDVASDFFRYKLSPAVSALVNIASGEGPIGETTTPVTVARDLTVPLALRDVKEAVREHGLPTGTAIGMAAILGFGLSTFGGPPPKTGTKEEFEKYVTRTLTNLYRSEAPQKDIDSIMGWARKHGVSTRKARKKAQGIAKRELYDPLYRAEVEGDTKEESRIRNKIRRLRGDSEQMEAASESRRKKARERSRE